MKEKNPDGSFTVQPMMMKDDDTIENSVMPPSPPQDLFSPDTIQTRVRTESVTTYRPRERDMLISPKLKRAISLPEIDLLEDKPAVTSIFSEISPKTLKIMEILSWKRQWMNESTDNLKASISHRLKDTHNQAVAEEPKPQPKRTQRPQLTLRLDKMPSKEEAEVAAQRKANRAIAGQEIQGGRPTLHLSRHLSSGSDTKGDHSDGFQSPVDQSSFKSQWSPDEGRFTTKGVSISEAGIVSPDSEGLHLQYDLIRVVDIGRGGSGVVSKAVHVPTLSVVAVKDIPVNGRSQRHQMIRELHALHSNLAPFDESTPRKSMSSKQKPNPYVINFYDAFVDKSRNCVCLAMQYMNLGSLQDVVVKGGCRSEMMLSRIAFCMLSGLDHIHRNSMIHRDIKPHNILLSRNGEVKISDFGLARTLNDNTTCAKTFVGTMMYMAPERIDGADYAYAADIWSLGLTVISVALGEYPFPMQDGFFGLIESVSHQDEMFANLVAKGFSTDFCDFVRRCLVIDPEVRGSAAELLGHPFIVGALTTESGGYISEWKEFFESNAEKQLQQEQELENIAQVVYKHIYENTIKFSKHETQSEMGANLVRGRIGSSTNAHSVMSRFHFLPHHLQGQASSRLQIRPVEKSLQIGLARTLDLSVELVFATFEHQRQVYSQKLIEQQCFASPQSWTASPGINRRHELLDEDEDDDDRPIQEGKQSSPGFWGRFRHRVKSMRSREKAKKSSSLGRRSFMSPFRS